MPAKISFTKYRLVFIVAVLLVGGSKFLTGYDKGKPNYLLLPSLNAGCRLFSQNESLSSFPAIAFDHLFVSCGWQTDEVTKFSDLKGKVLIRNEKEALNYVRLSTSLATYHFFTLQDGGIEIMPSSEEPKCEMYGLTRGFSLDGSGYMGVLSPEAFRAGHFSSPKVVASGNGFKIIRWVFTTKPTDREVKIVEQIEELVAVDGGYSCKVLQSAKCPALPKTKWEFQLYE